jgi:hypothetical protein
VLHLHLRGDHSLWASTPSNEDAKEAAVNSVESPSADIFPKSASVSAKQKFIGWAEAILRQENTATDATEKTALYEAEALNFTEAEKK